MSEAEPNVHLLARHAVEEPDAPALTIGSRTLSRRELDLASNRWAHALAAHGVGFGDFVTVALDQGVELFLTTIAIWKLGAVPQPVSSRLPVAERQAIVELAGSRLVVGAAPDDHLNRACLPPGFAPAAHDDSPLPEVLSPALNAPTSGGSTGRPKVIVSGSPAVTAPDAMRVQFGMAPDDRQLVCSPLYHNAPFRYAMAGLVMGQHLVVQSRFDARTALEQIAGHRVTWLQVVPTMLLRMLRVIEAHPAGTFDLSSIRALWHMAAPCPEWLKQRWIELLGPERLFELYGGTEGQALTRISGTEWLAHRGSVGTAIRGEVCVLDDDGRPAPPGEIGEIYLRPPSGDRTYRYLGAEAKARGEWESLGDLGWMDADGYLYVSDRRADLIVAGGANVYPAEVEAALDAHPAVLSSVVVGLPDDDLGQRVHAIVQAVGPLDGDELGAHLAERLVRYKIPRSFEFTAESLRDDAGKVRRGAHRDAAAARARERGVG